MTITHAQVADLQPGDVVRLSDEVDGWTIEGVLWSDPVSEGQSTLRCGPTLVRSYDGTPTGQRSRTLTLISRAPRPLYVNHPRTEPALGDVVRMERGGVRVVMRTYECGWVDRNGNEWDPKRKDVLRLLVDGETGQVVR